MGVGTMGAAIVVLFFLPWIDRCKVKSIRYRLGWLAMQPATEILTFFSRVFTFFYFAFFAVLYVTSKNEKTKPVPERVTS